MWSVNIAAVKKSDAARPTQSFHNSSPCADEDTVKAIVDAVVTFLGEDLEDTLNLDIRVKKLD